MSKLKPIRIAVCGARGRMGQQILALVHAAGDLALSGAVEYATHPDLDKDVGDLMGWGKIGLPLETNVEHVAQASDVVIDFSHADVTLPVAKAVAGAGKALIIGTTGHDAAQTDEIRRSVASIPVVWAPNMSVGVTLLFKLVGLASQILGEEFDAEVVEMHHRMKKDAPSGTAMKLGHVISEARHKELDKHGVFARHGMVGEREPGSIGMQTLRGGDVVGEHTVYFAGQGERLALTHLATSREIFAHGALRAARWLATQQPGLYDMFDVLGLK